jgi:hypothetical protein
VAHRAGNRLDTLHAAALSGARLVEADVRLFRRRLELRHLKTVGPVPLYWDRGELTRVWRRLVLADLLGASGPAELMLDLKGPRRRLGELVAEALEPHAATRRFTVCARRWALLEPFERLPVRRVHSVGTRRELRRLLRSFAGGRLEGVSIHERLVSPSVAAELRELTATVLSWPVNDARRARELVELGVAGLITDRPELLAAPVGAGAAR